MRGRPHGRALQREGGTSWRHHEDEHEREKPVGEGSERLEKLVEEGRKSLVAQSQRRLVSLPVINRVEAVELACHVIREKGRRRRRGEG